MKKIGDAGVVVVVVPNEKYTEYIKEIANELAKGSKAVCYVSLNKLYASLNRLFDAKLKNKFFVIDGITKSAMPDAPSADNCVYVSSASALTELSLSMNQVLNTGQFDSLLFDSLSTLLIYNKGDVVTQFVHDQMGKVVTLGGNAVFTCLEGDTKSSMIKDLGMFVDKVIHLK
ncbi:MAG: DUF7504 family protein [Nanobdellota archaeon]